MRGVSPATGIDGAIPVTLFVFVLLVQLPVKLSPNEPHARAPRNREAGTDNRASFVEVVNMKN